MPLTFLLALIAGLLNFIPYIGAVLGAVPAVIVAFGQGPMQALWVVLLFLVIQTVEGYLLVPFIQQRTVQLPPALLIFSQTVFGTLFGSVSPAAGAGTDGRDPACCPGGLSARRSRPTAIWRNAVSSGRRRSRISVLHTQAMCRRVKTRTSSATASYLPFRSRPCCSMQRITVSRLQSGAWPSFSPADYGARAYPPSPYACRSRDSAPSISRQSWSKRRQAMTERVIFTKPTDA